LLDFASVPLLGSLIDESASAFGKDDVVLLLQVIGGHDVGRTWVCQALAEAKRSVDHDPVGDYITGGRLEKLSAFAILSNGGRGGVHKPSVGPTID
jgi:hypothetical protein